MTEHRTIWIIVQGYDVDSTFGAYFDLAAGETEAARLNAEDSRDFHVTRPNLDRLSTFDSLWHTWRDAIRVLIRVLQPGPAVPRLAVRELRHALQ